MSVSISADTLLAGSDAYNADVAKIKRVVTTIKGLLEKRLKGERNKRQCFVWLVGTPDTPVDGHVYGMGFTYYPTTDLGLDYTRQREVVATFKFIDTTGRGNAQDPANYPFDTIDWSALSSDVPLRQHIATLAQSLDLLIVETIKTFPEIEGDITFFCDRGTK